MKSVDKWTYSETLKVILKLKDYFSMTNSEDWIIGPTTVYKNGVIIIIGSQLSKEASLFFDLGFAKGILPQGFYWMDELEKYKNVENEIFDDLPLRVIQALMYKWGISERFCDGAHAGIIKDCNKIGMLNRLEKIMNSELAREKAEKQQLKLQTGMSGEFLVAGKLFKLGLMVSITLGNAKSVDLFASDELTSNVYEIQVKTLRKSNCYIINRNKIKREMVYVFVLLNFFENMNGKYIDTGETYFIVSGKDIIENERKFFGSSLNNGNVNFQAINIGSLSEYKDNWGLFKNGLTNGQRDPAVVS